MTADQFFALPESNLPVELIEGEIVMSPAPIPKHQLAVGNVYLLLRRLTPNGQVFIAPIDVYLSETDVVQPDIVWVADGSACQVLETHLRGAPDLVIEVLSPGTARRDKSAKFRLYQAHGTREYWMIDPSAQFIEVWRRIDQQLVLLAVIGPGESFISPVLDDRPVSGDDVFGLSAAPETTP